MYQNAPILRRRLLAAFFVLTLPGVAFAYVDPGTGAYLVQSIMAVIAAATLYAARSIRFIRNFFAQRKLPTLEEKADDPAV
jgi:hypothetical protein